MKDLKGCNAVVTGASYGVGAHIARALAEAGVNLALVARSADKLESLASQIRTSGVRAVAVPVDLCDQAARMALVPRVEALLGPVDILVNNAGSLQLAPLDEISDDRVAHLIELDFATPIVLTRAVLPGMLARRRGHIVQVASVAGRLGMPFQSVYCASKHGLVGFTHSLQGELEGTGVGASVLLPGLVEGDGMWARLRQPTPKLSGITAPEHVARAVVELIRSGHVERIVNPMPVRPLVMAGVIAPRWVSTFFRVAGVTRLMREMAAHVARQDPTATLDPSHREKP